MKIAESNVALASSRQYAERGARGASQNAVSDSFFQVVSDAYESSYSYGGSSDEWLNYGKDGRLAVSSASNGTIQLLKPSEMQNDLLSLLLKRMKSYGLMEARNGTASGETIGVTTTQGREVSYEEYESTTFQARGEAVTEDGRKISFNIQVQMSRSYMEYTNFNKTSYRNMLVDPLIVNVGDNVADITDQTFLFDLDVDGTEENIPMLGSGSGFLALDRNGDGVINDGSELFGTQTGDGFAELRQYDSDGNGWIDENDEIFSKLKVWCKGKNGEDILMNLKEADIGAIFLGEQETEFTVNGSYGNTNGVIRSTGFFLRESGSVGTVQHVDLSVQEEARSAEPDSAWFSEDEEIPESVMSILIGGGNENDSQSTTANTSTHDNTARDNARADRLKAKEERRKAMEERRIKKKEQQRELEERFARRRAEHRRLMEQIDERHRAHKEELEENYKWQRFKRGYNIV